MTTAQLAWARRNKERIAEYARRYRAKAKEVVSAGHQRRRQANPMKYLLKTAKNRARARGIEFTIGADDVVAVSRCPLLGIEVVYGRAGRAQADSASLDRVDPTIGYVAGNVRVISYKANAMKQNASRAELERFAAAILGGWYGR